MATDQQDDSAEQQISGGEMLIRALQDAGAEYIFGYPGGSALHIYDAIFKQQKIEHILVRHEQAATHMADAYARVTGKPGVVLVTSGPGATNAVTGIATAYMDSIPMIVISGQVPNNVIGTDAFQETDMVGVSRPVVKHSFIVKDPEDIPAIVWKAFHIAATGRPGPGRHRCAQGHHGPGRAGDLQLPEEDEAALLQSGRQRQRPADPQGGRGAAGGQAAGHLCRRRGNHWATARRRLRRLARLLNYPVTNTLMGLGCFPGRRRSVHRHAGHARHLRSQHDHASRRRDSGGRCARFDDRVTNNPDKFCPDATIIHIDVDPGVDLEDHRRRHPHRRPGLSSVLTDLVDAVESLQRGDMSRCRMPRRWASGGSGSTCLAGTAMALTTT